MLSSFFLALSQSDKSNWLKTSVFFEKHSRYFHEENKINYLVDQFSKNQYRWWKRIRENPKQKLKKFSGCSTNLMEEQSKLAKLFQIIDLMDLWFSMLYMFSHIGGLWYSTVVTMMMVMTTARQQGSESLQMHESALDSCAIRTFRFLYLFNQCFFMTFGVVT